MIRTAVLGVGCLLGFAGGASAQYPGGYYPFSGGGFAMPGYGSIPNVMPNIYNPRTQPLSPYLNLLRGGNPGVNYYYGVRPGTVGGASSLGAGFGLAPGGFRPTSFPVNYSDSEAVELAEPGKGYILPPAGHPVVFGNTLGYFPGSQAMRTGMRPGTGGAARPTTPRR
ncbi:MAG TPA: hypothetical protein VKE74_06595 [Gemmataceae bacterium]|nr:hypothetical protein [Gemmataceae bacterium]